MHAPLSSWIFLALTAFGALLTVMALVRGTRLGWGNTVWFVGGWLASELALFHIALSALVTAGFWASGALGHLPGRLGLVLLGASWLGLLAAQWRARPAGETLEAALAEGLGPKYREQIPATRLGQIPDEVPLGELVNPFALRRGPVEWLRDVAYGEGHERHSLDIYRPAGGGASGAPVLLQIHGGGWTFGNKHEQALPLIYFLVARGWVVVAPNYRLSPQERFPAHLLDVKRAFGWTRRNIARYGGDPDFIAVTGGSAGGHLTALMGLTANDRSLQHGFEEIDTRPAACVPFYGVFDFLDRHGLRPDTKMTDWLAKSVMPGPPAADPALWDLASPMALLREDAPPFFVLHGTHDSLAQVEEARLFVRELRRVSRSPVVYAELPGAQHAWEVFHTVRAQHSVRAVARFLEWVRAGGAGARPASSSP